MRLAYLYGLLAALQCMTVQAQNVPVCAASCLNMNNAPSGCSPLDVHCYCTSPSYVANLSCCLQAACRSADLVTSLNAAQYACASVNVSIVDFPACEDKNGTFVPVSSSTSHASTSTHISTQTTPQSTSTSSTSMSTSGVSSTTQATSTTATLATDAAQTSPVQSQQAKSSSGLGTGASIAIGVSAGVAVIILCGMGFIIYRQRRTNATRARYLDTSEAFPSNSYPTPLESKEMISELSAKSERPYELSEYGNASVANRYELDDTRRPGPHT